MVLVMVFLVEWWGRWMVVLSIESLICLSVCITVLSLGFVSSYHIFLGYILHALMSSPWFNDAKKGSEGARCTGGVKIT